MAVDKGDIQITMGVNTTSYNSELDEAKKKAEKTGKQIKNNLQKAGKGFQSMNKFGGKFGGVLKNITEGITGLLSPIGLVMAAIAGLGTLAVKVWDKMTESAQQFKDRISTMGGILKKQTDEIDRAQKQQEKYVQILVQMASKQKLSTAEKILAIKIIEELTKRYGDLGISINQTTGKIENLDKAMKQVTTQKNIRKSAALKAQRDNAKQNAHWQSSAMIGELSKFKDVKYDRDKYKSLQDARNMGFDVKFSPTHDFRYFAGGGRAPGMWHDIEISDEQKELRKLWNEGGLKGKREFARQMIDRSAGDKDRVKMFKDLYDALDQYILKEAQYDTYVNYGATTPQQLIDKYNSINSRIKKFVQQDAANNDKNIKAREKRKQDFQFKNLKTDQQKISVLQKRLNEQKSTINEFDKTDSELRKKSAQLAQKLVELYKKTKEQQEDGNVTTAERLETEKESIDTLKEYGKVQEEIVKNNQNLHNSYSKQLQLELQIKELKLKSADYYKDALTALDAEVEITKLKLQGLTEQAEKQQLINELKAKGLMVDQAEVDKILAKRKQLAKLNKQIEQNKNAQNFNKGLKEKGNDLVSQATKQAGLTQQTRRQEALKNAEKEKGAKLTDDEIKKVEALADAQALMESNSYNFDKNLDIKTNQMTSRGGFASGAVEPWKWDVNNQIRDAQQQSNRILQDIKTILQNGGVI